LAFAVATVVDFDAALQGAGLNPATTDGNGDAAGAPNGILDSDELALEAYILADETRMNHATVYAAYEQNLAQMNIDLAAPFYAAYRLPLAGYTTLGDAGTFARVMANSRKRGCRARPGIVQFRCCHDTRV
jgi:hypothetical protein